MYVSLSLSLFLSLCTLGPYMSTWIRVTHAYVFLVVA